MAFRSRPLLIPLIILAAALVAFLLYLNFSRKEPTDLKVTGIVDGIEVNLAPKVAGKIASIGCREGDRVSEGQLLVTLDSDDVKASVAQAAAAVARARADIRVASAAVESAASNIVGAEADIRSARADQAKAESQLAETRQETERRKSLLAEGFIPQETLDQAALVSDVNAASLDSAREKLNAARTRKEIAISQKVAAANQLESAKAGLAETEANLAFYRSKLADTGIKAPVSGTVIFKALEKGEMVSPGATILTIVDLGSLYARVDIDETRIGRIALGRPAFVTVEGVGGKTFDGSIAEIGRFGEFATQRDVVRGREDIKTFRVKVRFDDSSGTLKPGMTVEVRIPLAR
ncbi:MAG TPA: efflux RND transporter periplasmic adaptor subunit [Candidatus Deferrimicrobiaceae bacterium]|jgi:HlyD family secretion protein